MDDTACHLVEHRTRAFKVLGAAADQGAEAPGPHLRDRAEHRRVDQPRTHALHLRRQLTAGHRLQGAHFDEQLVFHVAGQEPFRTVVDPAHAVIFGNDRDDEFGFSSNRAWIGGDRQAGLGERFICRTALIPAN